MSFTLWTRHIPARGFTDASGGVVVIFGWEVVAYFTHVHCLNFGLLAVSNLTPSCQVERRNS